MSAVAENLMTAEEFEKLPDTHMRRELVRGKVTETMPESIMGGGSGAPAEPQITKTLPSNAQPQPSVAELLRVWVKLAQQPARRLEPAARRADAL